MRIFVHITESWYSSSLDDIIHLARNRPSGFHTVIGVDAQDRIGIGWQQQFFDEMVGEKVESPAGARGLRFLPVLVELWFFASKTFNQSIAQSGGIYLSLLSEARAPSN